MKRHFLKGILSVTVGALLLSTIALTYGGSNVAVNAAPVQDEEEGVQTEFKNSFAFSKESIEADPRAPDDRVETAEVKAAAAAVAPSAVGVFIPIPVPLPGGIDYVANGAGTRNARQSTIRLRGACPGSIPVAAFLYWGVIMQAPPAFQVVSISRNCGPPVAVLGTLVAASMPPNDSPVPPAAGSVYALYRSNVLGALGGVINADFTITGIPTSNVTGADPWTCGIVGQAVPRSEGTSLIVLFTAPGIPPGARVYINDGAVLMAPPNLVWQIFNPLTIPIPPHQIIKHTRIGGDGQVGRSTFSVLPIATERSFIGPNFFGPFVQLRGPGSPFNGDSDWNGTDGESLNQLWDTHTSSIGAGGLLPVGSVGYWVQYATNGDNIVPNVHVLGVR